MTTVFERPERSCFNLTHYAKLIPESHAVFVMPPGCSRILRLSAIEEGISHRFTMFDLEPADLIGGGMEELLLQAAESVLARLTAAGARPRIFCLFVSCVDGFIGTDHAYVLETLRRNAPDIVFLDLAVDPINRDVLAPLVRLHDQVTALFEKKGSARRVNWLGSYLPPGREDPLAAKLRARGIPICHLSDCQTLTQLQACGDSAVNIAAGAAALPAVRRLQARFGTPYYDPAAPGTAGSLTEEALLNL